MTQPDAPQTRGHKLFPEHEPECSIHWRSAVLTPQFVQALAAAQADVQTIGKEAWQEQQRYNYSTADAIIEEARRVFAVHGIVLLTCWDKWPPSGKTQVEGANMWIDWNVRLDWGLLHAGLPGSYLDQQGDAIPPPHAAVGLLTGAARTVAIGSKGSPPDKSLYAARTSLSGYVALGLGSISRAVMPASEDIDQRNDEGPTMNAAQVRNEIDDMFRVIVEARRTSGLPEMKPIALRDMVNGEPFSPSRSAWLQLHDRAGQYVDELEERIQQEVSERDAADDPTVEGE